MVRFECDFCQRLKQPGEAWILGFAAESIGSRAARREITIASHWDESRAVAYLAVHFCSDACRHKYTARLFAEEPSTLGAIIEREVEPETRVVRVFPGGKAETRVTTRKVKTVAKTRRRKIA